MKKYLFALALQLCLVATGKAQHLKLNHLEYFERQGVNILVTGPPVRESWFTMSFNTEP